MTSNVVTVDRDVMLPRVAEALAHHRVSALAVTDDKGSIVGVISRTDLVRIGRRQAGSHRHAASLTLPERRAAELVTDLGRAPVVVSPTATLREAAKLMCEQRVHRLFVTEAQRIVGVISTLDMMSAVCDAKIEIPIAEIMSKPLFSVKAQQPISVAVERLEQARVTGLVVLEDDWPVGLFTQVEAMESRDLPRDTRIDEVLDPSLLCLPSTTKVHRAAAQAQRMAVRRIIPCQDREAVGIVTGFDFAKLIAA
jgi:predicted transcriptional regulator